MQNELGKSITNNSEILKECQKYFQKLYTEQNTCKTTQNELLQNVEKQLTEEQNSNLIKKNTNI